MTNFRILLVVIGISIVTCAALNLTSARRETGEWKSQQAKEAVLEYLRDVALSSRKALRLYYQADCHSPKPGSVDDDVPFPVFVVQPPSEGSNGVAAVREIFKNAKEVTVKEEPEGIIRIWVGKAPTEILRTRISQIHFDRQAQYDPDLAIGAIESTKEMHAAKKALGVASVLNVGGLMAPAERGVPRLPVSMKNVTVDQTLDTIAKTWGGPVVYGACTVGTGKNSIKLFALWYGGAVLGRKFGK